MPSTILDWLAIRAHNTPDAPAFVIDEGVLRYGELYARTTALASVLVRAGLAARQRCALRLPGSADAILAVYAVQLAGGVPVIMDPGLTAASVARRVRLVRPAMIIGADRDATLAEGTAELPSVVLLAMRDLLQQPADASVRLRDPEPSDEAYLQFTSGTTGDPRALAVSHRALLAQVDAIAERFDIQPTDIVVSRASLGHSTGLVRCVFGTVRFGCRTHLIRPTAFDIGRWLSMTASLRATITHGTDFAYRYAARAHVEGRLDLRALRVATNGGDVVRPDTIIEFERRFGLAGVVQPAYGLSEATLIVASGAPDEAWRVDAHRAVSCGRPLAGLTVRIIDAAGARCLPGVSGEIHVSGSSVFEGYVDHEMETRTVLRDGWLATGDIGALDEEGRLYPLARSRAMIKRAGLTIAPGEIEDAVEELPGVAAAVAMGAAQPGRPSDDVIILVEVTDSWSDAWGAMAGRVQRAVGDAVGLLPARIVIARARAVPRTEGGKIRRGLLPGLLDDEAFRIHVLFDG